MATIVTAPAMTTASTGMIADIQAELRKRGYDIAAVTGRTDAQTTAAIRTYQADAGSPVTGRINVALLRHLRGSDAYKVSVRDVSEIESALDRRGYSGGPIDGLVDANTTNAIRTYQRDAGLIVTGRADAGLLDHLRTSKVPAKNAALRVRLETHEALASRRVRSMTEAA